MCKMYGNKGVNIVFNIFNTNNKNNIKKRKKEYYMKFKIKKILF